MPRDRRAQLTVNKSLVVEKAEEEADELRNFLLRLFSHKSDLELLTLPHLRDFVLKLANAAEDSSDIVISLVAKAQA